MELTPGRTAALALTLVVAACDCALAAPRVVVTVKPVHSLVAAVMAGVGEPQLIVRGAGSPHTYSLKPSEARLLENAQVIFWVGEPLETFMGKPLAALGSKAQVVELMRAPGMRLLPGRLGDPGDGHVDQGAAAAAEYGHDGEHDAAAYDGHIWLDPANARVIARAAAEALGRADPANRGRYAGNAEALVARIAALDAELKSTLAPVRGVPFVVFHDAYQYFENSYGLRAIGSVAVSPERKPGAHRVKQIRDRIRSLEARCVFSEPQFPSALLATLLEGTQVSTGTLDPHGADLPAGPDAYFTLMRGLAASLLGCLQQR